MNNKFFLVMFALMTATLTPLRAVPMTHEITQEIPVIEVPESGSYEKIANVAQYGRADWENVIGIAKNVSPREAKAIADTNPEITYFFYMKGVRMVLVQEDGAYRVFRKGDAVFFSGEPWWGSAVGYADGYVKQ